MEFEPTKTFKGHQKELDELKEKDPEFYKFLKEEDASLLQFDGDDINLSDASELSSDEEFNGDSSSFEDGEAIQASGETPSVDKKPIQKHNKEVKINEKMLEDWRTTLIQEKPSVKVLSHLILAFKAAVANIDTDVKNKQADKKKKQEKSKKQLYSVTEANVFNLIVGACIECIPTALGKFLNYNLKIIKKKKKFKLPSSCSKWPFVSSHIKLYLINAIRLLDLLMDASVKRIFLRHLLVMSPYIIAYPKLSKHLLKSLIRMWSSESNETIRVLSFFFILRLLKLNKELLLELAIQRCYLSYVSNCKFTTPSALPMINFMQQTFTEICTIDKNVTYSYAFAYIRNLAIHLRNASIKKGKDMKMKVYNWQFIHSIALWCRVLTTLHPNHILQPLHYPLIQVALGTIELEPTKRYFPLRFRILENLIKLGDVTNTYIPLLNFLITPLELDEMKSIPKGRASKPLSLDTLLKFSAAQLSSRCFMESTCDKLFELFMKYVNSQAHTIAFPEMIVPAIVFMKRQIKSSKNITVNKMMSQICKLINENSAYIKDIREKVTFEVTDVDAVNSWERHTREEGVPFHKHFQEYKSKREREIFHSIAEKDLVVTERLPTVDHEKFHKKFKAEDKREFAELFEGDDDVEETLQRVLNDTEKFKIWKKPAFGDDDDKVDDGDDEDIEMEDEVATYQPSVKKTRIPLKLGLSSKDTKDVVENLCLSDIE